jgi:dTDP-4-dehydrorhamnose reductase
VNAGHGSWDEIAREAARLLGVVPRLVPITLDGASLKAPRPKNGALATGKLAAAGFSMPHWSDALRRWLASRTTIQGGR